MALVTTRFKWVRSCSKVMQISSDTDFSGASIPNDLDDFPSSPDLVTHTCPRFPTE